MTDKREHAENKYLDTRNGAIHYKLRLQCGGFIKMTVKNTKSMRMFVEWVKIHD
jgi:hypothetical protein